MPTGVGSNRREDKHPLLQQRQSCRPMALDKMSRTRGHCRLTHTKPSLYTNAMPLKNGKGSTAETMLCDSLRITFSAEKRSEGSARTTSSQTHCQEAEEHKQLQLLLAGLASGIKAPSRPL